jgi:hypothetical protein
VVDKGLQRVKSPPEVTLARIPEVRQTELPLMAKGRVDRLITSLSTWMNIENVDQFVTVNRPE